MLTNEGAQLLVVARCKSAAVFNPPLTHRLAVVGPTWSSLMTCTKIATGTNTFYSSVTHPDDVLRNKPVWQLLLHNTNLCCDRCSDAPDSPYPNWPKGPRYGPSPPDSPYCSYSPTSPQYFGHRPSSPVFDHRDVMVLSLRTELQDARVGVACLCRTKLAGTHSRDELTQALDFTLVTRNTIHDLQT